MINDAKEEINKIKEFCGRMGLDYGEVDVLLDSGERRIYIVDVNNNPAGPTQCLSEDDLRTAVVRSARPSRRHLQSDRTTALSKADRSQPLPCARS